MMSDEYIEFSAKTLEDAVKEASQKLSVSSDRLDVEVVDQGSSGFLGFNAKPAVIRVKVKETSERADKVQGDVLKEVHEESFSSEAENDKTAEEEREPKAYTEEEAGTEYRERENHSHKRGGHHSSYTNSYGSRDGHKTYVAHSRSTDDFLSTASDEEHIRPHKDYSKEPKVSYTDEQIRQFSERATDFLQSVFHAMHMEVTITTDFDRQENILTVDFEGEDMGVLIGKRGQTLDSIQYLTSLVVNKGIPGYVHVKADTEDYRERRKKTLENLARNMAAKVKRTRRSCALEPMNPYERRIIHSALQGDRYVTTYSEGEDPYRHVVVTLKK